MSLTLEVFNCVKDFSSCLLLSVFCVTQAYINELSQTISFLKIIALRCTKSIGTLRQTEHEKYNIRCNTHMSVLAIFYILTGTVSVA